MINSEVRGGGAPRAWTHLRVDRRSASYMRVTFDHPPINTITATTVVEARFTMPRQTAAPI